VAKLNQLIFVQILNYCLKYALDSGCEGALLIYEVFSDCSLWSCKAKTYVLPEAQLALFLFCQSSLTALLLSQQYTLVAQEDTLLLVESLLKLKKFKENDARTKVGKYEFYTSTCNMLL